METMTQNSHTITPSLIAPVMNTRNYDGYKLTKVKNGRLTDGITVIPVNHSLKQYDDGRIEVDGKLIHWDEVVKK